MQQHALTYLRSLLSPLNRMDISCRLFTAQRVLHGSNPLGLSPSVKHRWIAQRMELLGNSGFLPNEGPRPPWKKLVVFEYFLNVLLLNPGFLGKNEVNLTSEICIFFGLGLYYIKPPTSPRIFPEKKCVVVSYDNLEG